MPIKKLTSRSILTILIAAPLIGSAASLFQVSTYGALTQKAYEGEYTYAQLETKGDFGLGSFNDIDGEMVALDGHFYKVLPNGKLTEAKPNDTAPFADVVFFKPAEHFTIENLHSYAQIQEAIAKHFKNKNHFYTVKIEGDFNSLQLRNLKKQSKPFPPIAQVVQEQAIYNLGNTKGTAVGIWGPSFLAGVAVPGFHVHFVSKDKTTGGHILKADINKATVYVMPIDEFSLYLTHTQSFANADLSTQNTAGAVAELATKTAN